MTRFESFMLGFGTALILLWCGQAWAGDKWDLPFEFTGTLIGPSGVTLYSKGKPYSFRTPMGPGGYSLLDTIKIPVATDMDRYPPSGPVGRIPWAGDSNTGVTQSVTYEELKAKQIRKWAASGDICRVIGRHFWERIPMYEGSVWNLRRSGTLSRCSVCGFETNTERWE